jgi:hypothetical protein
MSFWFDEQSRSQLLEAIKEIGYRYFYNSSILHIE